MSGILHLSTPVSTVFGLVGASCILLGFYRTSIGKWTGKSFWYELDNLVGASLLIIYQLSIGAYVTLVLNIVWVIVAFAGITSIAQRRRGTRKK
jgi:membrane-bound ClpP family serine protease